MSYSARYKMAMLSIGVHSGCIHILKIVLRQLYVIKHFVLGTYIQDLHKMVYLQNQRFSPDASELRLDSTNFPDKSPELNDPPSRRSYETMKDIHMAYRNKVG